MSLYSTCTYLHLIIVFLQQCCMSGTSEVHCGGLSLKRSARGAGWVVCVCANVWSLLESIGHVLIYVDEGAMDWFRAWVTSSQETRELHRDLEERSKTQALSLFEHARAPSRSADDYRWLVRSIVAEVFDLKLWIVGQSLRRKSCRAARGTYWVSYCSRLAFPSSALFRSAMPVLLAPGCVACQTSARNSQSPWQKYRVSLRSWRQLGLRSTRFKSLQTQKTWTDLIRWITSSLRFGDLDRLLPKFFLCW